MIKLTSKEDLNNVTFKTQVFGVWQPFCMSYYFSDSCQNIANLFQIGKKLLLFYGLIRCTLNTNLAAVKL